MTNEQQEYDYWYLSQLAELTRKEEENDDK